MFFELSNGTIINLNHVTNIPIINTGHAAVCITMINGGIHRISKEDATSIRIHFRSLLINPS